MSSSSDSRHGLSHRCTAVSTADSAPPEVCYGTDRIISELVKPLVPEAARWAMPCRVRRLTKWCTDMEMKSLICRHIDVESSHMPKKTKCVGCTADETVKSSRPVAVLRCFRLVHSSIFQLVISDISGERCLESWHCLLVKSMCLLRKVTQTGQEPGTYVASCWV